MPNPKPAPSEERAFIHSATEQRQPRLSVDVSLSSIFGFSHAGLLLDRQPRLFPAAPAAVHRNGVAVAHLLEVVGGESRAVSTAAVKDEFGVFVGECLFDVSLDHAFAKMNGPRNSTGSVFSFFPLFDDLQRLTILQASFHVADRAFANAGLRVVDDRQEPGRMLLGHEDTPQGVISFDPM